jgi:G3E family GTPase
VIATVDAVHGSGQFDHHPESVKQVAMADRLVLTKTDVAPPAVTAALSHRIRGLNPAAPLIVATQGQVAPSALFNAGLYNAATKQPEVGRWLNDAAYGDHDPHHRHDHEPDQPCGAACGHDHDHDHSAAHNHDRRIGAFCLVVEQPMPWQGFLDFVDVLIAEHGERVLRLKGLLNIRESDVPLVVHGVQHMFHPVVPMPIAAASWC